MSSFYIVANADLKMKKGKIAAQVSHVTRMAFKNTASSRINIDRVIVLKASQNQIEQLISKYCKGSMIIYVVDAGLTQVEAGSITCLAVRPGYQVPIEIKQLKLL